MELTTTGFEKSNSNWQQMGETRDPMAEDCWRDAHKIAALYADVLGADFWLLYAAKPHVSEKNVIVAGWQLLMHKPPEAIVGVLVFHWKHEDSCLEVDTDLSLVYDIPLEESEMSKDRRDMTPSLAKAAEKSGVIWSA